MTKQIKWNRPVSYDEFGGKMYLSKCRRFRVLSWSKTRLQESQVFLNGEWVSTVKNTDHCIMSVSDAKHRAEVWIVRQTREEL